MSLDPKTNRQEREAEKAKKRAEEPPLNPRFPHKRQSFDPFFFSLERETPDEEEARKAAE
ncbi:MAG: hypothetical protein QOE70_5488 [Chthoniobacter sp.]|jgi:hypothetical protein|nr:hypothetical protein [Chthoniobacter sp.]